jgi:succinate dehydrogenase / fumarate reductase flavoprotein subunit
MSYPQEMQQTIKSITATRQRRVRERFPTMSLEERKKILDGYHPDHIAGGMRELCVGLSKGKRTPLELADVIEGRPWVCSDFDLGQPALETDVLVIGF